MNVVLGHMRQFVIDDERHVLDVETARSDIRRDKDLKLAVLERGERFESRRLCLVAVDRRRCEALFFELPRETRRTVLRAHEAEHLPDVARPHDMRKQCAFRVLRHLVRCLNNRFRRGIASRDFDQLGLIQQFIRELFDLVGKCCGEQQILALCRRRQQFHDALDVGDEPHVEHPIGLVQNQDLDLSEVDALLLDVIEQPARRRDQYLDAGADDR